MAALTPYNRLKNFVQYALDHPTAMYNASDHDAELNAIELTLDGLVTNLNLLQRNDGLLANLTVHPDSLTTATLALIASTWTPRGLWITARAYVVGDVVEQASASYVCSTAHTSGVFATDHTAGKWIALSGSVATLAASAVTVTPVGNIAATDAQAALQELDSEKAKLAGDGAQLFSVASATAGAHGVRFDQAQNNSLFFAAGGGSGNAITATINPAGFTVLPDGFEVCIRAPGANTVTNPTLNLTLGSTATGAKTIVRGDSAGALRASDIAGANHEMRLRYRSSSDKWLLLNPAPSAAIGYVFDGGGTALTTGVKGDLLIPFACTIQSVTLQADQSGSIVIDIWKKAYALDSPPTVANTITAAAKPTLAAHQSAQDTTLASWTTAIAAGDMLRFNIDSIATCTRVTLTLNVVKG